MLFASVATSSFSVGVAAVFAAPAPSIAAVAVAKSTAVFAVAS